MRRLLCLFYRRGIRSDAERCIAYLSFMSGIVLPPIVCGTSACLGVQFPSGSNESASDGERN